MALGFLTHAVIIYMQPQSENEAHRKGKRQHEQIVDLDASQYFRCMHTYVFIFYKITMQNCNKRAYLPGAQRGLSFAHDKTTTNIILPAQSGTQLS